MPAGRPPVPTALRVLRGNPGRRPLNDAEPKPVAGRPRCPSWLSREAKQEWRRIVPELERLRVLTAVDGAALAAYCQSFANWRRAEEYLAENSYSVALTRIDRDGNEIVYAWQQRPEVAIGQKERALMKSFLIEFGLTPASRSRIKASPAEERDPLEDFIRGAG